MTRSFVVVALVGVAVLGGPTVSRADIIVFSARLNGPSEAPPNASPGIGSTVMTYDSVAHTLRIQATFSGLLGNTTAAHIHSTTALPNAGTAGVATQLPSFVGFPLGVTSGTFDNTYDLTLASSWNPTFITNNGGTTAGAEAAMIQGMRTSRAYLNIHSTQFPGGEIRGFLSVPEPSSLAILLGMGAVGLIARVRRRTA